MRPQAEATICSTCWVVVVVVVVVVVERRITADMFSGRGGGDGGGGGGGGGGLLDMDGFLGGGMSTTPAPVVPQGPQLGPAGLNSTQEFGQLWGSHGAEVTGQAATALVHSPEDFMQLLAARCNLQGVQAIAASEFYFICFCGYLFLFAVGHISFN